MLRLFLPNTLVLLSIHPNKLLNFGARRAMKALAWRGPWARPYPQEESRYDYF
jgi:hypothetical protein